MHLPSAVLSLLGQTPRRLEFLYKLSSVYKEVCGFGSTAPCDDSLDIIKLRYMYNGEKIQYVEIFSGATEPLYSFKIFDCKLSTKAYHLAIRRLNGKKI